MNSINSILNSTFHRPYPLPPNKWIYYHEWNNALFLHWKVPLQSLRKLVPIEFEIDTFDGNAYISLVAFSMQEIRPKYLPSVEFISNFDEINLRTYIKNGNKTGVYFLQIEAEKSLSVFIAKFLSGLPYQKAEMDFKPQCYKSFFPLNNCHLDVNFELKNSHNEKSELEYWLTERYCLFLKHNNELFTYDIHHLEWELNYVDIKKLHLQYQIGDIQLTANPDLVNYSPGVQVLAWGREKFKSTYEHERD